MNAQQYQDIAIKYRVSQKKSEGVVVIYQGKCQWDRWLGKPSQWKPGCVAVTALGHVFKTTGGNDDEGAEKWVPFCSEEQAA